MSYRIKERVQVLKRFSLLLVALLVLSACGSAESGDSAEVTDTATTTTEAVGSDSGSGIQTAVEVSWEVSGNSVSVFIKDANGDSCVESTNPDCEGLYVSWEANFDDLSKNITYEDPIVINDLVAGDQIDFLLLYQEIAGGSEPIEVKRYPFVFNG